jgi:hypothetical protein
MNRQPSLFDTPPKPREMDLHPLRRHCQGRIATLNRATYLPWTGFYLKKELKDFFYYGSYLPKEEFDAMLAEFKSEIIRTRATHIDKFGDLDAEDVEQLAGLLGAAA